MAIPAPPPRQLDTVSLEKVDDLIDADCPCRSAVKSRDFPELASFDVRPSDVEFVLFDYNSVDSFAACWAAHTVLGDVEYCGVNRSSSVDDVPIELVHNRVVAMLGICWPFEAMHELTVECKALFVLDNHISVAREMEIFSHPHAILIIDENMGAGALAWNSFRSSAPVPALLRGIEDAELGRQALRGSREFALGFEATCNLNIPRGDITRDDPIFAEFGSLIGNDGGRSKIDEAIRVGHKLEPGLQATFREAASSHTVASLQAFPSWTCALANVSSPLAGSVAELLVADLASRLAQLTSTATVNSDDADAEDAGDPSYRCERCFAAVFEINRKGFVRVSLRSLPGGPDVSEIAAKYDGCGNANRAFFMVPGEVWDSMWIHPETVLWDVTAAGPMRLKLDQGDTVTVAWKGERFMDGPFDEWSWGYCNKTLKEGWFPTLAHSLMVATREIPSIGHGITGLEEGEMLIARRQRGKFLLGYSFQPGSEVRDATLKWYKDVRYVGQLRPVHATAARASLALAIGLP